MSIISGQINALGAKEFPSSYGGIKVDDAGDVTIYVAGQDPTLTSTFDTMLGSSIHVTYVTVRYSLSHLQALAERVAGNYRLLRADGVPIDRLVPDITQGTVDVTLVASTSTSQAVPTGSTLLAPSSIVSAQATLDARYGSGLQVQATTGEPATATRCTGKYGCRTNDFAPFNGGDSIYQLPGYTGDAACSDAFGVIINNSYTGMLTAGHCSNNGSYNDFVNNECPPSTSGPCPGGSTLGPVGVLMSPETSTSDYAEINTSVYGAVWGGTPTQNSPPDFTVAGSTLYPSDACCLTTDGARTGEVTHNQVNSDWFCGTVQYSWGWSLVCGLGDLTSSNVMCQPGDSGGPVYEHIDNYGDVDAAGVIVGGIGSGTECYFEELDYIFQQQPTWGLAID